MSAIDEIQRWKRAYWASLNDSAEERKEILERARKKANEKRKAQRKATAKPKKATTGTKKKPTGKKKTQKTVMGEVLSLFD